MNHETLQAQGQVDVNVRREAWEHLKPYGYAPGGYTGKCHNCGKAWIDQDKRSWSCRECAEKMHTNNLAADEAWQRGPDQ